MSGLIESASAVMAASERRLEAASLNVANVSTPGYRRQRAVAAGQPGFDAQMLRTRSEMEQGKTVETANPLDIAIRGDGFFQVRDGTDLMYSRQGTFRLSPEGMVVTSQGYVLQQAGGGDLVLDSSSVSVVENGTVLDDGRPVGRIGVFLPENAATIRSDDGAFFRFDAGGSVESEVPQLRQGAYEASNVAVGDEMVSMMTALRQAESGSRLVQTYDDLLGRAITAFGQNGR